MHSDKFLIIFLIFFILISFVIFCGLGWMKVYKLLFGTFEDGHLLPSRVIFVQRSNQISSRAMQMRIDSIRMPYRKMKGRLPPILETTMSIENLEALDDEADFQSEVIDCANQKVNFFKDTAHLV